MTASVSIHGRNHRRGGVDPLPRVATLHIKVFSDDPEIGIVVAGTDAFVFAIAKDMDGLRLRRAEAFVSTVSSSGPVTVQARNRTQGFNLLSPAVTIDAGERNSRTASTAAEPVDDIVNEWADEIAIDVTAGGTGAVGLGVILEFA